MSVTVSDLLKLPSLRQASVIGGRGGLGKVVSSISVLESTDPTVLVNEVFPHNKYAGGEIVITGFLNCVDDIDRQCSNLLRLIDGGEVGIGLESTIIDLTEEEPTILRPGYITQNMLSEVLGSVEVDRTILSADSREKPKAPGMKYRHYAPKGDLTIVEGEPEKVAAYINARLEEA